jgi:hypothetical protein
MSDDRGGREDPSAEKWPVGFIVLVVAAAIYLLFRLIQGIGWLADWIGG